MEIDPPQPEASTSRLERVSAPYDDLKSVSDAFVVQKVKPGSGAAGFRNQYASVYFSRLMALKKTVTANADARWKNIAKKNPTSGKSQRVLDIKAGSLCYVVGTIYLEMRLKPNILEDISRETNVTLPPPATKFFSDDDEVMLEDESGRVRLVGRVIEERKFPLVTGIIAAVLGAENASGDFEVIDVCFAGMPPQPSSSQRNGKETAKASTEDDDRDDDVYVAICSGLELGTNEHAADERAGLLMEWLAGEAGSEEDRRQARQVTRLILAGNSMAQPVKAAAAESSVTTERKPRKVYGYDSSNFNPAPTLQLDSFLAELLTTIDVDIMSGEKDPNGTTLPQQPLHEALLPKAGKFDGFKRLTNPTWFEVAGASFLGTSGQNLDDIFKYLESHDRLSMAASTLEWSHMAPTAPDTLFCYPFHDRDPFILTRTPDIYFIGNQPEYATRLVTSENDENVRTRVILVPKFVETGQIVLVKCRTLKSRVIGFLSMPE